MLGLMVWLASMVSSEPPGAEERTCAVEVSGMPVSVMSHHQLVMGDGERRRLTPRLELTVTSASLELTIEGPRYRGELTIFADDCRDGAVLELDVEPLPARVDFPCAPSGLTVTCRDCFEDMQVHVLSAEDFPELPMSSFARDVEVLLRAPGYRRQTRTLRLHPGPNTVHVDLEPIG